MIAAAEPADPLRRCLDRLAPQVSELAAELLVVLNRARESVSEAELDGLRRSGAQVLFEPRVGKSHALNTGVAASRGEVVAFTDDDAEPADDWLARITRPLLAEERPSDLVGCGGRVTPMFPGAGVPRWYRDLVLRRRNHFLGPRHEPSDRPFDYRLRDEGAAVPFGVNCAYLREVFRTVQFDPDLGPNRVTGLRGGEDTLLALHVLQQGRRIVHRPEARVGHPVTAGRTTIDFVLDAYFYHGIQFVRMQRSLGQAVRSADRMRRRLSVQRLRVRVRSLGAPFGWLVQAACRHESWRGMLAEIDGSFRGGTARPGDSDVARAVKARAGRHGSPLVAVRLPDAR